MRTRLIAILLTALPLVACTSTDETSSDEPIVIDDTGGEGDETTPPEGGELAVGEDPCETDADCVPAGCCHAAACVAQANAPDCGEVMCTSDCQFGTLDCGGACLCHEGRCAARLSEPPDIAVEGN
ncbi:MAG: hypothetical protein KC619_18125 [Myxococcales bacterium]|nr:hypothetical protein [Myxococcales bacterium]